MSKSVGEQKMIWVWLPGGSAWLRIKDETTTPMQTTSLVAEKKLFSISIVESKVTYIKSINTTWEAESGNPTSSPPEPPGP